MPDRPDKCSRISYKNAGSQSKKLSNYGNSINSIQNLIILFIKLKIDTVTILKEKNSISRKREFSSSKLIYRSILYQLQNKFAKQFKKRSSFVGESKNCRHEQSEGCSK